MNIAIDIRAIGKNRTGDEVYTLELVKGLMKLDTGHTFYLFTDTEDWYQVGNLRNLSSNWKVIPLLPKSKLLWTEYLLPKACEKYHIDLLHIQYIAPLFFLPKYTKLISTIHDISWKFVPEHIQLKDRLSLNTLIPPSIKKSDAIITVSQHSRYAIQNIFGTDSSKIHSIYNGGAIQHIPPVINTSAGVRGALKQDYILYLGSLQPRKNIPTALKAFAEYLKTHPESNLHFVIAGGRGYNYDTQIDAVITEYEIADKVIFVGFITNDEKIVLIKQAKAFIFLSLYEGFGIPIIEAMSLNTPVISSNTSCLPEIVGDAGVLVDPYDIEAITKAITFFVHNPLFSKEYKDKGLKRAKTFTWEKMASQTYDLYKKLLLEQ
jgi:glycosyltransferase involved in cell wall biosynthesis